MSTSPLKAEEQFEPVVDHVEMATAILAWVEHHRQSLVAFTKAWLNGQHPVDAAARQTAALGYVAGHDTGHAKGYSQGFTDGRSVLLDLLAENPGVAHLAYLWRRLRRRDKPVASDVVGTGGNCVALRVPAVWGSVMVVLDEEADPGAEAVSICANDGQEREDFRDDIFVVPLAQSGTICARIAELLALPSWEAVKALPGYKST